MASGSILCPSKGSGSKYSRPEQSAGAAPGSGGCVHACSERCETALRPLRTTLLLGCHRQAGQHDCCRLLLLACSCRWLPGRLPSHASTGAHGDQRPVGWLSPACVAASRRGYSSEAAAATAGGSSAGSNSSRSSYGMPSSVPAPGGWSGGQREQRGQLLP